MRSTLGPIDLALIALYAAFLLGLTVRMIGVARIELPHRVAREALGDS